MKISIITICWNNEKDIRPTIESVINQTYNDIEYIIVDGASQDHTLDIVKEYGSKISKIISEKDKGLYDAINKGFHASTGDIVGMIHAGDRLHDVNVISDIANFYKLYPETDISYGHSKIVRKDETIQRINKSPQYSMKLLRRGWMPSHQSIYCKRDVFLKYGDYRLDRGGGADYEWVIRYFYKYGKELNIRLIDRYIIKFSLGGQSTKNYSKKISYSYVKFIHECWRLNNLRAPMFIVSWMFVRKIKQFFAAKQNKVTYVI